MNPKCSFVPSSQRVYAELEQLVVENGLYAPTK